MFQWHRISSLLVNNDYFSWLKFKFESSIMSSTQPGPSGEQTPNPKRKSGSPTLEKATENKQIRLGKMIDRSLSNRQDGVLRILECPVCMEIMEGPILQCSSGHSFCANCISKLPVCPECRTSFGNPVRNLSLEKLSEQVTNSCPNKDYGCQEKVYGKNDPHENRCPFREYDCPIAQDMNKECSWKGRRPHILTHVSENHPEAIFNLEAYKFGFINSFEEEYVHHVSLMYLKEDIFVLYDHYEKWQGKFWKAVCYLGPTENASKFVYQIIFVSADQSRKIEYTRRVHTEDVDVNTLFENDDCFTFTEKQIKSFKIRSEDQILFNEFSILCV